MSDNLVESVAIPIAHEEIRTSKREVETGRVRVRTVVDTHEEIVREELMRSAVHVERVKVNIEVEAIPVPRTEGETLIIPVVEEVIYVRKALVVVEEIRLHKSTTTELVEQPVTVRSQRAVIDRDEPGSADRGKKLSTPKV